MDISKEQLIGAMAEFDAKFKHLPEWLNWVDNHAYKYAIFYRENIYPVKKIVSLATGVNVSDFLGGTNLNKSIVKFGFQVISLRPASWEVKSGKVVIKTLDKSAFSQGTGIPIELRPFFLETAIQLGEHREINLSVNGKIYPSYIAIENNPPHRTRLFWNKDFIGELASRFPEHYEYAQEGRKLDGLPSVEMTLAREGGFQKYSISFTSAETLSKEWSDEELEETVKAYLWMLGQETAGIPYSKLAVNQKLRDGKLYQRTKGAIEYRMQNISSVLSDLCHPRIQGYHPAKNVGTNTKSKIAAMLEKLGAYEPEDYAPSDDDETLNVRVKKLREKGIKGKPKGQTSPRQVTSSSTSYYRDPLVKAWVLENAKGICEGCNDPAPFLKNDGEPYLEVHHVIALADAGEDTIENTVALCPCCHRRCHVSGDKEAFKAMLSSKIDRLLANAQN